MSVNPRSTLLFLVIGLLIAASLGLDIWLLLAGGTSRETLSVVIGFQVLLLLGVLAAGWAWHELRVFRPLKILSEQIGIITRSNPAHVPKILHEHDLGALPQAVDDLGRAFLRAHRDAQRSIGAAVDDAEKRKQWLEAILRDLTEGVVVCNLEHRIVLFNAAATHMLPNEPPLGLRRDLRTVIAGKQLETMLKELKDQGRSETPTLSVVQADYASASHSLRLRMGLVADANHRRSGYVLSFSDTSDVASSSGRRPTIEASPAERPEFYDFDLFHQTPSNDLNERSLAELDYVVFDTETTGLKPSAGDEIVQIAGVRVVNQRVLSGDTFNRLVNPGRPIPPSSTRFHGITDDMVLHEPDADRVLPDFHAFVDGAVLVAHNAAFDLKFLKLKEQRTGAVFNHAVLDTLLLSVVLHPSQEDHGLDAIAERFGVEIQDRHTALGDAVTTAGIFVGMLDELKARDIKSMRAAVEACDKVYEIRRAQHQF